MKKHFYFKDSRADLCGDLSYLCCSGQTTGGMIWRKTVPTQQRSLLWPVSWNCSEYCTALAMQLLCSCKGWRKKLMLSLECMETWHLSLNHPGSMGKCILFLFPVVFLCRWKVSKLDREHGIYKLDKQDMSSWIRSSEMVDWPFWNTYVLWAAIYMKMMLLYFYPPVARRKDLIFNLASLVDLISELAGITRKCNFFFGVIGFERPSEQGF